MVYNLMFCYVYFIEWLKLVNMYHLTYFFVWGEKLKSTLSNFKYTTYYQLWSTHCTNKALELIPSIQLKICILDHYSLT